MTVLTCRPAKDLRGGGGFTSGSSGWDWYDGRNLAAAGPIVVVTANYRLGPLGYLYLPDLGIENLGTKTRPPSWPGSNATSPPSGEIPGTVTAGGQSAGAFSALYLALSPVTGPHITRVITQSGPWGLPPQDPGEAAGHARRFLEILGLNINPDLAVLRAVPARQLLAAYQQLARDVARPGSAAPPMYPVLGGSGLPEPWEQAPPADRLDGKPLLTGTTRDEMAAFFALDPRIQAITASQASQIVAGQVGGGAGRFTRAAARHPDATPAGVLTEIETEIVFRDGTLAIAGHPAYVYQFDYTPVPDPPAWAPRTAPSCPSSSAPSTPSPAARCSASPLPRPAPSPARSLRRWRPSPPPAAPMQTNGTHTTPPTRPPSGTSPDPRLGSQVPG